MVVALGAVDPHPEKRPGNPRGQPIGRGPAGVGVERDGDEIGRRMIGPEALLGDQVA